MRSLYALRFRIRNTKDECPENLSTFPDNVEFLITKYVNPFLILFPKRVWFF